MLLIDKLFCASNISKSIATICDLVSTMQLEFFFNLHSFAVQD